MSRTTAAVVVAVILVVAGVALRAVNLDQPLAIFHPTRQFRSALLARACFYDHRATVPDDARRVARANRALQPAGEPPFMEWLTCEGYAIRGREDLALGHALAALFWSLGALAVYGIGRRVGNAGSATVGVAVYMFLPYAVVASRAFQPDPLMTAASLWAVLALQRYHEHPSSKRFALAALGIAIAALVKPMSVFFTVPSALALTEASRPALRDRVRAWAVVAVGLAPAAAFYGYGAVFGTLARDQMKLRFVPSLLTTEFFWNGLLTQIRRVFGLPVFVAAAAGTIAARPGPPRWLLAGLWCGYAAFAVAFTYHMPTHDYYHLPYVALAALATTALVDRVTSGGIGDARLGGRAGGPGPLRRAAPLVIAVAFAFWGTWSVWPRLTDNTGRARIAQYEEIGAVAEHTTRAVFLDLEYGYPLMYHGEVSGDSWPNQDDLSAEARGGAPRLDAAARFERDYSYGATYFIVTDLASLAAQPDLQRLLAARTTVVRQTPQWHVYRFTR